MKDTHSENIYWKSQTWWKAFLLKKRFDDFYEKKLQEDFIFSKDLSAHTKQEQDLHQTIGLSFHRGSENHRLHAPCHCLDASQSIHVKIHMLLIEVPFTNEETNLPCPDKNKLQGL